MALYLTERDVTGLLSMTDAVSALDDAFKRQAAGKVINQPRRRLFVPQGTYHTMVAADLGLETFGIKAYTAFRAGARFLVLLYSAKSGDLLAMIEADRLGQMRTGAATGVATRHLAKSKRPLTVGIYGSGWQARSQLEAVTVACDVESVAVYSRDPDRRVAFCDEMTQVLEVPVSPVSTPESAAEGKDVVITATTAKDPVLRGAWLSPGVHVNAAGSNMLMKREIDDDVVKRSDLIVVDSIEQSKTESGDLLAPFERRLFRWEQVAELSDVVGGPRNGRENDDQITLFKSNGLAMEDIAVATIVHERARAAGVGTDLPMRRS